MQPLEFLELHHQHIIRYGYDSLGVSVAFERRSKNLFRAFHVSNSLCESLWRRGWLYADKARVRCKSRLGNWGKLYDAPRRRSFSRAHRLPPMNRVYELHFSRFRLVTLYYLLKSMDHMSSVENFTSRRSLERYCNFHSKFIIKKFSKKNFGPFVEEINDLAVVLQICSALVGDFILDGNPQPVEWLENPIEKPEEYNAEFSELWGGAKEFFETMGFSWFEKWHESLRFESAILMDFDELYYLLRFSSWNAREMLEGDIGVAMVLRESAELLRRVAWVVFRRDLPDEDMCFGDWAPDGRHRVYGDQSPFRKSELASRKVLEFFQLHSAHKCVLYVEGVTEYGYFSAGLEYYGLNHVCIVNIAGSIKDGSLTNYLRLDKDNRRYSFIAIDGDRPDTLRQMLTQVRQGSFVGSLFISSPNFERGFFSFDIACSALKLLMSEQGITLEEDDLHLQDDQGRLVEDWNLLLSSKHMIKNPKGLRWGECLFLCESAVGFSQASQEIFGQLSRTLSSSFDSSSSQIPVYDIGISLASSISKRNDTI